MASANRSSAAKLDRRKLARLYLEDETAWMDQSARLIQQRRYEELDYRSIGEFLSDMAKRDRREVFSRLVVLLVHVLKWHYQATERTRSWERTILAQRKDLNKLLESGTLRNHAEQVLSEAYDQAVREAAIETGINAETFPSVCPYTLEELLQDDDER